MPIRYSTLLTLATLILPVAAPAAALTLADLNPGDLLITEYLANPAGVPDAQAEYFEIYNARSMEVELAGLVIRDDGSNAFTVSALIIDAGGLAVFSASDGAALGIVPDYIYGSAMSLTNTGDEIELVGTGDEVLHRLAYTDGDAFGEGVSHELAAIAAGSTNSFGPAAGTDFVAASAVLPLGNVGSPGALGNSLPAVPLPPAAWLFGSALALLVRGVRRNRSGADAGGSPRVANAAR